MPVLLIDETVRIDSESLELIKEKLIYTEKLVYVAAFSAAIFSVLAAIIVILYALHRVRCRRCCFDTKFFSF